MLVAVDQEVAFNREAFAPIGSVRLFSGRCLRPEDIRDADALIVRSVTRVNESLVAGSRVRFVGTTSTGMDNLDVSCLSQRGIYYVNAAGCNAESVAEYIAAVLLEVSARFDWELEDKSLAIVGVGNIGSRVERMARALGMPVLLCDPPLRDSTGEQRYRSLAEVLGADIVTLHVPLTREGRYPTYRMMDRWILKHLAPRQLLINTSRGPVVNGGDLKRAMFDGKPGFAVLDVWEAEPRIDYELLDLMLLGTSHIAGYSIDGKVRATEMILHEMCRFFDLPVPWNSADVMPNPVSIRPAPGSRGMQAIRSVVRQAYDVREDDRRLRSLKGLSADDAAVGFDGLRKQYVLRPEFRHYTVELPDSCEEIAQPLQGLGFLIR